MNRKIWDRLVSTAAMVLAVALVVLGGLAIYGGNFGHKNVTDRLAPEKVFFAPLSAMTPEEKASVGQFAGQQVTTGPQAEGFATYIAGHLALVNDGKTYAETSAAARADGVDPKVAADLGAKADTLFKGETLRSIMLNAYGWWTVASIALFAGYVMIATGIALAIFAALGFRHAKRATPVDETVRERAAAGTTPAPRELQHV
ncbi:MAG: hypothetical protein QOI81_1111 [Actinomycetota bacterium]|jgi:hypothetical protein|nr:hypothetical protein [Actinomycetota bacterium]